MSGSLPGHAIAEGGWASRWCRDACRFTGCAFTDDDPELVVGVVGESGHRVHRNGPIHTATESSCAMQVLGDRA